MLLKALEQRPVVRGRLDDQRVRPRTDELDHGLRVADVVLRDRVRSASDVEVVAEEHLGIDHVAQLHHAATAAEVHVERKAWLAFELRGRAQERIRQRHVA